MVRMLEFNRISPHTKLIYLDEWNIMDISISEALKLGVEAHQQGKLDEADKFYTAILKVKPDHPQTNYNMGHLANKVGKSRLAIDFFTKAAESDTGTLQYWKSLIETLVKLQKFETALDKISLAKEHCDHKNVFDVLEKILQQQAQHTSKTKQPSPADLKALILEFNNSNYTKTIAMAQQLLAEYPTSADLLNILGSCHRSRGEHEEAIKVYKKAIQLHPNFASAHNNLGITYKEIRDFQSAIDHYKIAINLNPAMASAHNNIGVVYMKLEMFEKSVEHFTQALELKPNYADALNNIGTAHFSMGDYELAQKFFEKALSTQPKSAQAHINLGALFSNTGNYEAANKHFQIALGMAPGSVELLCNIGNLHQKQRQFTAAQEFYQQALKINSDVPEVHNNLGNTFKELGDIESALKHYNFAIDLRENFAECYSNLLETLEKWNRLSEMGRWIETAKLKVKPFSDDLKVFEMLYHYRRDLFEEAFSISSDIKIKNVTSSRCVIYYEILGKICDKMGKFDLAFECFTEMNKAICELANFNAAQANNYFTEVGQNLKAIEQANYIPKINTPSRTVEPIFLVGFPRSGTTLLDTILRSHSKINVVEEKYALAKAKMFLANTGKFDYVSSFPSAKSINEAIDIYFDEIYQHLNTREDGKLVVDKLPLNILELPFAKCLFPKSKIVFALRHPFDCILSNWMQNFELNKAMSNMTDLQNIVDFYCLVMQHYKTANSKLSLDIHHVKYEDIVSDLEKAITPLIKFLDLSWEPELQKFQRTAVKRERINTPSYSQVIRPLYKSADGRWINYARHLKTYIPQISPWLKEFGYPQIER